LKKRVEIYKNAAAKDLPRQSVSASSHFKMGTTNKALKQKIFSAPDRKYRSYAKSTYETASEQVF
jgi:hypothetical protein